MLLLEEIAEIPPGQQKMVIRKETVSLLQRELQVERGGNGKCIKCVIFILVIETKYLQFLLEQKIVNTKPYPANVLMCLSQGLLR